MESINWGFNAALAVSGFVLSVLAFSLLSARKCSARHAAAFALGFSCLFALVSYTEYRAPESLADANELLHLNQWAALSCDGVELRVKADERAFSRQESRAQGKSDACEKVVS